MLRQEGKVDKRLLPLTGENSTKESVEKAAKKLPKNAALNFTGQSDEKGEKTVWKDFIIQKALDEIKHMREMADDYRNQARNLSKLPE